MKTIGVLIAVVICSLLLQTSSCGDNGIKPSCSWVTCRVEWRDWSPRPNLGRGVMQRKKANHIYERHSKNGDCPASQNCNSTAQTRTLCSCRAVTHAWWASWTEVDMKSNGCKVLRRIADVSYTYHTRLDNCNGVKRDGPPPKSKDSCPCDKNIYKAEYGPWKIVSENGNIVK